MGDPNNPTCLGCDYSLKHLETRFCPECGRAFNSNDPRTFGPPDDASSMKGWAVVVMILLFNGPIALGFFIDISIDVIICIGSALLLTFLWAAWYFPGMFQMVYNESANRNRIKKQFVRTLIWMSVLLAIILLF